MNVRHVAFLALSLLATSSIASGSDPDIEFRKDVQYGTGGDAPLYLNLARPKQRSGKLPVAAVIHGGGWSGGNKDMHDPQIRDLARHGYLAVSIGYRLAPKHAFPAQIEDCKCALRWLRANADELAIDPERIGVIGFSAGAHLALLLGTMDSADGLEGEGGSPGQSSKAEAVVAFAGPTDLAAELPAASVEIVERFIGGSRDERAEAIRQASPVTYVDASDAPVLIFHGTRDEIVPVDQATKMSDALARAGVPGRVELLIGAGHGWGSPDVERTLVESTEFLDEHLKK